MYACSSHLKWHAAGRLTVPMLVHHAVTARIEQIALLARCAGDPPMVAGRETATNVGGVSKTAVRLDVSMVRISCTKRQQAARGTLARGVGLTSVVLHKRARYRFYATFAMYHSA